MTADDIHPGRVVTYTDRPRTVAACDEDRDSESDEGVGGAERRHSDTDETDSVSDGDDDDDSRDIVQTSHSANNNNVH